MRRWRWVDGLLAVGLGLVAAGVGIEYRTKASPRTEVVLERREGKEERVLAGRDEAEEDGETVEGVININEAGKKELMSLGGVGEVLADRIIEYRKKNGGFVDKEEIKLVKGIGEKLYERIKDKIKI